MYVCTESEFPCPFLSWPSLISSSGYQFPHFIWIFTSDRGFGNVSPPHVFLFQPTEGSLFYNRVCERRPQSLNLSAVLIKRSVGDMTRLTLHVRLSVKNTQLILFLFLRTIWSQDNHLLVNAIFFPTKASLSFIFSPKNSRIFAWGNGTSGH